MESEFYEKYEERLKNNATYSFPETSTNKKMRANNTQKVFNYKKSKHLLIAKCIASRCGYVKNYVFVAENLVYPTFFIVFPVSLVLHNSLNNSIIVASLSDAVYKS